MKKLIILSGLFFAIACTNNNTDTITQLKLDVATLKAQNDSLQNKVEAIKPGLGDLMLLVQIHHNKLWFAGKEANWPLAQFEHDEIMEILKQAQTIETDRKEVKLFPVMIFPPLDSLQKAIVGKDTKVFEERFINLTEACNNCHHNVDYKFNTIKIPDQPPFSNQNFSPVK